MFTDAILKFVGKAVNGFMVPLDEEYDEILDSYNNEQQLLLTTTNTNHMTSSSIKYVYTSMYYHGEFMIIEILISISATCGIQVLSMYALYYQVPWALHIWL